MSKLKLIVTDLDGTLLNDEKKVSAYTCLLYTSSF